MSTALDTDSGHVASLALLVVACAGFALLLVAYGWRLLRRRPWFGADFVGPHGFAFLTVAAASNVLASRFLAGGHRGVATALLLFGTVMWVVLGYGVPLGLITARGRRPSLDQVNGTWFIWVVGTESVAVATAVLARLSPSPALTALASVCWAIGLVQYLLIAALALARLLVRPVAPGDLAPQYWVFMGAAAISVLAGAKLLQLPPGDGPVPHEAVVGLSVVLWSFCSWLIPILLALGVWRYVLRRQPLTYDAGLWSVVFPVGMYGVATRELGRATGTPWLADLGGAELWIAAAVWLTVFLDMVRSSVRALQHGSRTQTAQRRNKGG